MNAEKQQMNTLVIQSHRNPLPHPWMDVCLHSVQEWCACQKYQYQFIGNELFDKMPGYLMKKIQDQTVIATDLARLLVLEEALKNGVERVVWLDADFLIFKPEKFIMPDTPYAVGREVWVQHDKNNKLKVYKKVHNAMLMFRQKNNFLGFYIETAQRLLEQNTGSMPPQFIGPKLLTALHNVVQLPVMESAGMLSPLVINNIINGSGPALDMFLANISVPISGANLCGSSVLRNELSDDEMLELIRVLRQDNLF